MWLNELANVHPTTWAEPEKELVFIPLVPAFMGIIILPWNEPPKENTIRWYKVDIRQGYERILEKGELWESLLAETMFMCLIEPLHPPLPSADRSPKEDRWNSETPMRGRLGAQFTSQVVWQGQVVRFLMYSFHKNVLDSYHIAGAVLDISIQSGTKT